MNVTKQSGAAVLEAPRAVAQEVRTPMRDQFIPTATKDAIDQPPSRGRVRVNCATCGKELERWPNKVKKVRRNFCSRECQGLGYRVAGKEEREREYMKRYLREYVQRNRDKHNERGRAWARANRDKRNENQQRRRAGYQASESGVLRERMIALHGNHCLKCGTCNRIEVDHVVPVVLGGSHDITNVQPLCRNCNAAKGATIADYRIVEAQYGISVTEI